MNATANVISVNPSKQTVGAMNPDLVNKLGRVHIAYSSESESVKKNVGNFFYVGKGMTSSMSNKLLFVRVAFGVMLAVAGIVSGSSLFMISGIVAGVMLFGGLLVRPVMSLASLTYAFAGIYAMSNGSFDVMPFMMSLGCLSFAMFGAGQFSADAILRGKVYKRIYKHKTGKEVARRSRIVGL